MKSIVLIIPYFGKFPEWAPLYFETLKRNETIDFLFYTDCDFNPYKAKNISFNSISFEDYVLLVNKRIKTQFNPANPYKLCDLRPLYPSIHYDEIKKYDFYGWTDMDILFGDIRSFYTNEILSEYDVLSTHRIRVSGHFALFRNTLKNRHLYKKIYDWENKLVKPNFVGIDEHGITNALTMTFFDKLNEKMGWNIDFFISRWYSRLKKKKLYMVEQYTTPFISIPWLDGSLNSQQPNEWYYKDGVITNSRDGDRCFIYLHFMNFKSSIYRHDGTKAPWEGNEKVCYANASNMINGICINNYGITPL